MMRKLRNIISRLTWPQFRLEVRSWTRKSWIWRAKVDRRRARREHSQVRRSQIIQRLKLELISSVPPNRRISIHESTPWGALDFEVSMVELRKCKSIWLRSSRPLRMATLKAGTLVEEQMAKGGQAVAARARQRQGLLCRGSHDNPAICHEWV